MRERCSKRLPVRHSDRSPARRGALSARATRWGLDCCAEGGSSFARTIAYYEMAYNLAEMEEDLDQALDYARRSVELAPEEFKQFPLAALGWVHYKRREFDKAVDFLSRSTEFGFSSITLTHLGMALLAWPARRRERRTCCRKARNLGDHDGALQERMMEFMRDSTRLLESLRVPSEAQS